MHHPGRQRQVEGRALAAEVLHHLYPDRFEQRIIADIDLRAEVVEARLRPVMREVDADDAACSGDERQVTQRGIDDRVARIHGVRPPE